MQPCTSSLRLRLRHIKLQDGDSGRPTCSHALQVGLKPGLAVGTTAVACFVPGTGVSKAQSFGWCASCGCWVVNSIQLACEPAAASMTNRCLVTLLRYNAGSSSARSCWWQLYTLWRLASHPLATSGEMSRRHRMICSLYCCFSMRTMPLCRSLITNLANVLLFAGRSLLG